MAGITGWCSFAYAIKVVKQDQCQGTFGPFRLCICNCCPITYSTGPLIFSRHFLPSTALVKSECRSLSFVLALAGATTRSNVFCWRGNKHSYNTLLLPYNTSAEKWQILRNLRIEQWEKFFFIRGVTSLNVMNAELSLDTWFCKMYSDICWSRVNYTDK